MPASDILSCIKEADVQRLFVEWLRREGWTVQEKSRSEWAEVVASRGSETLVAEVKGRTSSSGTDIDTLFGQLLRRMTGRPEGTRYAAVVPQELRQVVERVPAAVTALLLIDLFVVDQSGDVVEFRFNRS